MSDKATTGEVEVKALESLEIKNESTGEVEAVIATLNVVDRDSEVILPGAIEEGKTVKMSAYGHDIVGSIFGGGGAMPVGRGKVHIVNDKAVFRGKVFTTTERGKETLAVLKEMGIEQEWSFGFRVLEDDAPDKEWKSKGASRILKKLDVFEVSPVLMGAGIGTQTVAAKAAARKAAEASQKAEQEAEAAEKAKEEAEAAAKEAERIEAEVKAQREAEEAEAKRLADEAQLKALAEEAMAEHERVQRSLKRLGLIRD